MKTWIALLRGINVGGHHKLPMEDLVAMLEDLGCAEVRTYIQSGNAVFRHGKPAGLRARVETAVEDRSGFRPRVLLLERRELARAIADNPFDASEGKALHFFFLDADPADADLDRVEELKAPSESYLLKGRVFYLHAPEGIGRSKLAGRVEACLGVPVTGRNWNTVARLMKLAISAGEE